MTAKKSQIDPFFYLILRYESADEVLRREFDLLTTEIRESIQSPNNIEQNAQLTFNRIFKLRLLILKSLQEDNDDIEDLYQDALEYFEPIAQDSRYCVLGENILFALRSNFRVANSLLKQVSSNGLTELLGSATNIEINFDQFVSVTLAFLPGDQGIELIKWLRSSLTVEYGVLVGALLKEEKLTASDQTIDKVAAMLAGAAQTFNAIAIEYGLFGLNSEAPTDSQHPDENFIKNQQNLANTDLNSFSAIWN